MNRYKKFFLAIPILIIASNITSVKAAYASGNLGEVYLLLHGTASDPTTWDDLLRDRFADHCPVTELGQDITEDSVCYRVEFADLPIGDIWENGDGSKFNALGVEVGVAIGKIVDRMHPAAIILVGHSRGGLAARAYLQKIPQQPPVKFGLLTIGTPHQGTPLGRAKHCLANRRCLGKKYTPDDVPETLVSSLCFLSGEEGCVYRLKAILFSPSVGYQATAHDRDGDPVRRSISRQIHRLNRGIRRLDDWVSTFGQLYSSGLRLGENTFETPFGRFDILDNDNPLGTWLSAGRFRKLRRFVLENIGRFNRRGDWVCRAADRKINNWACNGDGVVPTISQRLTRLPGFSRGDKPLHALNLKGISHTSETGRTLEINRILDAMENDLR